MGLFSHKRCEAVETVLRVVIDDQRAAIEDLKQQHREAIEKLEAERKEILDRLLLYANPNAAQYYDRYQRQGMAQPVDAPKPSPEQEERAKARDRVHTPAPRRPVLSPADANFRPMRPQPQEPSETIRSVPFRAEIPLPSPGEIREVHGLYRERHVGDGAIAGGPALPQTFSQVIPANDPLALDLPTVESSLRE